MTTRKRKSHVVVPEFVPIVCSTSKDKSVYLPPHKRNQKVGRKILMPKPPFRSQPKVLNGSKFVPTYHRCGVIGHIRSQCLKLKREQNHVARSLPKKLSGPKHIVCHYCGVFGYLRPHCSKFYALKRIKRKEKLELLGSCAMKEKSVLGENGKLLFGNVRRELDRLKKNLAKAEIEAMNSGNNFQIRQIKREIEVLLEREAIMWAQRSRVLWVRQGDRNTKYFHSCATRRYRKNVIEGIRDEDDRWRDQLIDISIVLVNYYKNLFTSTE